MRPRVITLFFAFVFALVAIPRLAFAQVAPVLPAALTPTSVTIALLAAFVAFLVQAWNTGKVFGIATVPVSVLPYVGVAVPFVSAVYMTISQAGALSGVVLFNALLSGFFALLGSGSGAAAHVALAKHFDAARMTRLAKIAKGPVAILLVVGGLGTIVGTQDGCGAGQILGPDSPIPADLQADGKCLADQLLSGNLNFVSDLAVCAIPETQTAADLWTFIVDALEKKGAEKGGLSPAQVAEARGNFAAHLAAKAQVSK